MLDLIGIGVDLCAIERISRAIEKEHFRQRVFTDTERAYLEAKGKAQAQSAAAMFAAKEAVAKALGTGFSGGIMPEQIGVVHDDKGAPGIELTGAALEALKKRGGGRVLLSLSHEGGQAAAFAVITKE